jgi:1-acyl-sn-glycerol-3-phosphate acyltransferase
MYWLLKHVFIGPILKLFFPTTVEGLENIPEQGAAILAGNHLSYSDWLFMPLQVKRRVTFLAKAEYFTGRGVKGALTKGFFAGAGQVPIDRSGGSASEGAVKKALEVLAGGNLLGLYPEGTRSPDGRLYRGKTGIARMALEAGVPVIPVAVIGTFEAAPPGKRIPVPGRITVRFGQPLDFSRYAGLSNDRFVLRSVTDEIMYELMQLSGQEYVDTYASRAKAGGDESGAARARELVGSGSGYGVRKAS